MRGSRLLLLGAVAGVALAVGGCGEPQDNQTVAAAERAVREEIEESSDVPVGNVSCPDVYKITANLEIICNVTFEGGDERSILVTFPETNSADGVEWDYAPYDYPLPK